MTDTADRLVEMFEADRDDPGYLKRFAMYGFVHSEIGGKPWHPPAELVWQSQGAPQPYDDPEMVAEVWALLKDLHTDYQHATGGE